MNSVCVLVPTYNGEKYIVAFLNSLLKQTYRPIRVIISDDASTDNTVGLIEKWKQKRKLDDKFTLELIKNKENKGLAHNIKRMSQLVKEDYVFLADQDDIWHREKVACQVFFLSQNPDVIECICDRSIIDKNNKLLCKSENKYLHLLRKKMTFEQVICRPSVYAANGIALRGAYISDLLDIPSEIVEQDTYITTMAATYGAVDFIHRPLVYYRVHSNNLSGCYVLETNRNIFKIYRLLVKGYKRANAAYITDGKIIARELKRRRGINLKQYHNKLLNRELKKPYLQALEDIVKKKKVNYFYR